MRILAIESTAKAASAAILRDGAIEALAFQNAGLTHSRTLLPMISDMLKNTELSLGDCDAVAVANGPGSFTGVRIGVAAAKGLALGAGLPWVGVNALEAMAERLAHTGALLLCAMDARRGEVYTAVFDACDGVVTRLCDDRAIPAGEAAADALAYAKKLGKTIICVGDGAELCYNVINEGARLAPPELLRQSAVGVALAAARLIAAGADCDAETLAPVYLRVSQAERERAARLAAGNTEKGDT